LDFFDSTGKTECGSQIGNWPKTGGQVSRTARGRVWFKPDILGHILSERGHSQPSVEALRGLLLAVAQIADKQLQRGVGWFADDRYLRTKLRTT
jgi:hypothetical protein